MFHTNKKGEMFDQKKNTKYFSEIGYHCWNVELLYIVMIENFKKEGLSLLLLSKAELDYEYTRTVRLMYIF